VNKKVYLGDSVYAEYDGEGVWLTTNNGWPDDPRNKIYIDPDVMLNFQDWWIAISKAILNENTPQ